MKAFYWKLRALYWFWVLADWASWDAATELYQCYVADDDPDFWSSEDAVREELSYWGD